MSYSASAFAFAFACDGTFTFALPAAVVLLLFHLLLHLGFLLAAPFQWSEAVSVLCAAAAALDYASVLAAVFASACDALAFAVGAAFA